MNLPAIKQAALERLPDLLATLLPNGTPRGSEYLIGNEHGSPGDSCSVSLADATRGLWHDHASGHGGDILDLVAVHHGPSVHHAGRWLCSFLGRPELLNGDARLQNDPMELVIKDGERWLKPSRCWTYRDASGAVIGWVLRFDTSDGKTIRPAHIQDGKPKLGGWRKPALKPIYNAHLLAQRPDAPVLVVEGEKTCDAASKLFPDYVCITPMGGSEAFPHADFACLNGRTVVVWPDADKPGRRAATYLKSRFPDIRIIPTDDLPDGWDLADEPPAGFDPVGRFHAAPVAPAPPPPEPFRVLGITDSDLFFHSHRSGDIISFTPQSMTELNLQLLANDNYWISRGYSDDRGEVNYRAVAKSLIDRAHEAGRFSPDIIRGRGCWIDNGRVVFNAGDRLYVDGRLRSGQPDSRYSYRAGTPIPLDLSKPASDEDGRLLSRICELLPYSDSTLHWILPAVLFLGPICGALDYRPGLWLDGESGSGKSTVYFEFFGRLWRGCCFEFKGATSEAGIRQKLGSDALPSTFDEAEARTAKATARLDSVLELIRQSSTETGGSIVKGSASGSAVTFEVRSMFALFSIAAPAMETADESRLARVTLTKNHDPKRYQELLSLLAKIDDSYCMRLRARAVLSVMRIRDTYETFRRIIAEVSGSSRKGQQFGVIASGMWCMENSRTPSDAEARLFCQRQPWATLGAGTDDNSDQQQCLAHLLQHRTYWQDDEGKRHDESVAGLIRLHRESDTERHAAQHALNLIGLHLTPSGLHVANKHSGLSAVFRNTQFAERWKDYLKRIPGAEEMAIKVAGTKGRYVRVDVE